MAQQDVPPILFQEVEALARELKARFDPPEYIPGCEVKDVTDINQYASNNGWIEALCAQHNQQRVRYKGQVAAPGTGDFIDVLYFPDRRLFEVFSQGGTASLTPNGGGGVWPEADQLINTSTGTEYTDAPTAIAAIGNLEQLLVGEGSFAMGAGGTISAAGYIMGSGQIVTSLDSGTAGATILTNSGFGLITDVRILGTQSSGSNVGLKSTSIITQNYRCTIQMSGAATEHVAHEAAASATLNYQCHFSASSATTNIAFKQSGSAATSDIYNGSITGDIDVASGCTVRLFNPIWISGSFTGAGNITGSYTDANGARYKFKDNVAYEVITEDTTPMVCQGRLSGSSSDPLPMNTSSITTIYFLPYQGNQVKLWDGNNWALHTIADAGVSLALTSWTASRPNDIYLYDNSGTLTLERVEWTNDSTRATAIVYDDGIYYKSGDKTRLYLGTVRTTTTTGQTADSIDQRFIWNYFNRVPRNLDYSATATHTYSTTSWRAWNNSTTHRVEFVMGVDEDIVAYGFAGDIYQSSGSSSVYVGVGFDTTAGAGPYWRSGEPTWQYGMGTTFGYSGAVGYHYIQATQTVGGGTGNYGNIRVHAMVMG